MCTVFASVRSIDSTVPAEAVFASEIEKLKQMKFKPQEYVTLEPYERDHATVIGVFRPPASGTGKQTM